MEYSSHCPLVITGKSIQIYARLLLQFKSYLRFLEGYFIYNSLMADVSLDDLIKQDREKNKANRDKNKKHPQKNFPQGQRFQDNKNQGRQNPNPQRQQEANRPFKKKFIKKDDRNQPRDNREKREKPSKPQENRSDEEFNEKQVRTLRVLGLSPEFKNEDLYKLFATEGAMEKCLIEQDNFGRNLNTAIVKYHNPDSAASAISNINRHKVMNCVLTVEPYKNTRK